MLPVMITAVIALVGILPHQISDPRLVFAVMFIVTAIYAKDTHNKYFRYLLTATLLSGLACFMEKGIIYASMFVSSFYEFRKSSLLSIPIYTIAGTGFFYTYNMLNNLELSISNILFIALAGGLSGALMESIDTRTDKRVLTLLSLATVFAIFRIYIPSASLEELAIAFVVSFILSLMALKAGVADESGLMSATLVGTITILFTDLRFFAVLLSFYLFGSAITKYKYSLKLNLGIAEPSGGARGFSNVFGNSLAPLFFTMNYGVLGDNFFALAFIASVATALGDTMASEVGKTAKNVYLITNFKKVKPGTNGGISVIGEMAALAGCLLVSILAHFLGILSIEHFLPVIISAFIAIHIDSLLGATLEVKGYLNNSEVNFLATLFGGIICIFLSL
ncbi:MAG: TIGR00297 family protein [Archaeoglobaceae archaeon]